jgi:hypothetical protein
MRFPADGGVRGLMVQKRRQGVCPASLSLRILPGREA